MALVACDKDPTFDASSLPAYRKSVTAINATLNAQDQHKLQVALITIGAGSSAEFTAFALANPSSLANVEMLDGLAGPLTILDRMRSVIEGRTARSVIEHVAADLDYEISRAERQADEPGKLLSSVVVENARYSLDRSRSGQATIEFSVYNGSQVPISTIYLSGELTADRNDAPLMSRDFSYHFPVMLQPGMQEGGKALLVVPGTWTAKQLDTPSAANIKLTISNVDDGGGKRLLSVNVGHLDAMRRKRDMLRSS
jgi:hypothetical protein